MDKDIRQALQPLFDPEEENVEIRINNDMKQVDLTVRERETGEKYAAEVKKGTSVDSFLQTTFYRSYVRIREMARRLNAKPLLIYSPDVISKEEVHKILRQVDTFTSDLTLVIVLKGEIVGFYRQGSIEISVEDSLNDISQSNQTIGGERKNLRFSDKELWLFKCWFYSQSQNQKLWDKNLKPIQNGNQLSKASDVSQSECYRWVNAMEEQSYLRSEQHGKKSLRRFSEYLERWNEKYRFQDNHSFSEMMFPRRTDEDPWTYLNSKLANLPKNKRNDYIVTGICASAVYGYQFVNVKQIYLYRDHDNPQRLIDELGLYEADGSSDTVVVTCKPKFEEALFKGANMREHLYVVDPLQLYLDCFHMEKRGLEQAETIRDQLLMNRESTVEG